MASRTTTVLFEWRYSSTRFGSIWARLWVSSFAYRVSPSTTVPHFSEAPMGNGADSCTWRTHPWPLPALPQRSSFRVQMPWLKRSPQARCSTTSCQNWPTSRRQQSQRSGTQAALARKPSSSLSFSQAFHNLSQNSAEDSHSENPTWLTPHHSEFLLCFHSGSTSDFPIPGWWFCFVMFLHVYIFYITS